MLVLAREDIYEFSPTSWIDLGFGGHNWRTYILDLHGGSAVERTRIARKTMVAYGVVMFP
mgnify:FL=1